MTYKVGIIGYGGMALYHHLNVEKPDNVVFTSAFDIAEERLLKAKENGLEVYSDLKDFLKLSGVDIVLVSTPNSTHFSLAMAAIEHGKHVILEKPATMNSSEFEKLVCAAKEHNVVITTHQNRRMDKDYRIIKQVLEVGTIGECFRVESRIEGSRGIADTWRRKKSAGGGMLYDWGVHLIDQILDLFSNKVTSVFCEFSHITTNEVDDGFRLHLQFDDGKSALIEVGTCNYIMHPLWYVLGKKGSIQINYWDLSGKVVRLKDTQIKWEDEIRPNIAGPSITMAPRAEDTLCTLPLPEPVCDTDILYRNFVKAIEGKEKLWVSTQETMRVMKIIDLAFESAEKNQVIRCNI